MILQNGKTSLICSPAVPIAPQAVKKKRKKYQLRAFVWIAPAIVLTLIFCYIPPVISFITSFYESNGVNLVDFVGIKNYVDVLKAPLFLTSLKNVLIITVVSFIFSHIANLFLAELLINIKNQKIAGIYRLMFVIPIVVPGIVGLMIWQKIIFSPADGGVANMVTGFFGIAPSSWYFKESTVLMSLILTGFPWAGGTLLLIYIASLQGISPEMIEATKLDGVGAFRRIISFHLPMMVGQIKYFIITALIGGMQNFTMQLIITGGGPGVDGASMVPGYLIFTYAFQQSDYGRANALGMVLFGIILLMTLLNYIFIKNKNSEEVV